MEAEVISVGDELTSGQRLDTNSQWISQRLGELGVRTARHTTVSDSLELNVDALQQAAQRSRLVIITGGLGPTLDDLTREAMARAFNRRLELHQPSLEHIERLFAKRQRPMPERNRLQAMLPSGAEAIPNPHGSAPGIDLQINLGEQPARLFALPGVPAEMKQMWFETVAPSIEKSLGNSLGQLRFHSVKVFGIGESDVEVKLPNLIARDRIPHVGITVHRATITLRIAGRSHSESEFQQLIAPTVAEIEAALGELVFGSGDDELQQAVVRELTDQKLSMASVEIGASSLVGDWMLSTNAPDTYAGSIAFPTLRHAERWLHSTESTALATGQLTPAACLQLAEAVRLRFGASLGLAVGIYPTVSDLDRPNAVFEVAYGLSGATYSTSEKRSLSGHPEVVTARIAKTALDIVRLQLRSKSLQSAVS